MSESEHISVHEETTSEETISEENSKRSAFGKIVGAIGKGLEKLYSTTLGKIYEPASNYAYKKYFHDIQSEEGDDEQTKQLKSNKRQKYIRRYNIGSVVCCSIAFTFSLLSLFIPPLSPIAVPLVCVFSSLDVMFSKLADSLSDKPKGISGVVSDRMKTLYKKLSNAQTNQKTATRVSLITSSLTFLAAVGIVVAKGFGVDVPGPIEIGLSAISFSAVSFNGLVEYCSRKTQKAELNITKAKLATALEAIRAIEILNQKDNEISPETTKPTQDNKQQQNPNLKDSDSKNQTKPNDPRPTFSPQTSEKLEKLSQQELTV